MVESKARRDLIVRAAWLYHERGLNQQAVADRLGISRSTISRLLADAETAGIVRVIVTETLPESAQLADALVEKYNLKGATVEVGLEGESPMVAAATALARRLEGMVAAGSITIAAGWGRTLGLSAKTVRSMRTSKVVLIDAFGHTTTEAIASTVEVTNTLGRKFGAKVMHMPSPAFAPTAEVATHFRNSEPVAEAMERARTADAIIVSVGVVGDDSLLTAAGYMTNEEMVEIIKAGAVGEVFGRYYDAAGNAVLADSVHPVSLSFDDLRSAKRIITAAGGTEKVAAIKGAITAKIINELAVDDSLARGLLA